VLPGQRVDVGLDSATLGIPLGERFSITYTSGATPIAVQYTSFDAVGRNQATGKKADGYATAFTSAVSPRVTFADGQMDPTRTDNSQVETLSIFNPFANQDVTLNYTVKYIFSDGTVITGATGSLAANGRVAIVSSAITAVRNKVSSGTQFRNYAIEVTGVATNTVNSNTINSSGLVVLTRTDTQTGRSVASTGLMTGTPVLLSDPIFGTGGGIGG
jgi:hypothetical protein